MSYIVIQRGMAELPAYSEFEDVDRAATYLEGVCNESESAEVKLYRLDPVDFVVRKVFKVEIPSVAADRRHSSPVPEFGSMDHDLAELDCQLSNEPRPGLFGR